MWHNNNRFAYVNNLRASSAASSNQVAGSLNSPRENQFRRSCRNFVDDSHTSRSFQHGPRTGKPLYPLPEASKHNTDNPKAFVGHMTKEFFIQKVADSLDKTAEDNKSYVSLPTYSEPESVFFSVSRPDIPTRDYITRLVTYTQCSPSAFVVMLIYLDRIADSNSRLLVTPYNMHRLLVTALTLACKVLDDRCFSNVHYAKVGGIPTAREMNRLELQFLAYVKYRLHVIDTLFHEKLQLLESHTQTPPVPELCNGILPPKPTDHIMAVASPVTPGMPAVCSPRTRSLSTFGCTTSTTSSVGIQSREYFPDRDHHRNSSTHVRPRRNVYEAIRPHEGPHAQGYNWTSPQPNGKRPRSKRAITDRFSPSSRP